VLRLLQSRKYSKKKQFALLFKKNIFFEGSDQGGELVERGAAKEMLFPPFFNVSAFALPRIVIKDAEFLKCQQILPV
jgi:hypothetical protein